MSKKSKEIRIVLKIYVYFSLMLFVGCSQGQPRQPASSGSEDRGVETDSPGSNKQDRASHKPLEIQGLQWGPYLVDDFSKNGRGIAWESGFISMRQIKSGDTEDLRDYRWHLSAVTSGTTVLPKESTKGCLPVPKYESLSKGAFVDKVSFNGAFEAEVSGQGMLQAAGKDDDFSYIAGDELVATVTTDEGDVVMTAPELPETHNLQLLGAHAGSLNVNTVIKTLNDNLENETSDLILADQGGGESYNVAVVVFFPGARADAGNVRCVIPAGERITITSKEYRSWLPLKGFVAFSAQTILDQEEADSPIWRSTIRGDGVEDLEIP